MKSKHLQIMKKKLISIMIVAIASTLAGTIPTKSFSAQASLKPTCKSSVSSTLKWYCLDESEEECEYPGHDEETAIVCSGEFYIHG